MPSTSASPGPVLLFGMTVARISRLTCNDINRHGDDVYLTIGKSPVRLPTQLATITMRLADQQRDPSAIVTQIETPRFLFPGHMPGYPLNQTGFSTKLARHGIPTHAGRNTALITLAADLPSSVLSDLFGMHPETALRWTKNVGRDWTEYLNARATTLTER